MGSFRASHFYFLLLYNQIHPGLLLFIWFNFSIITYNKVEIK
uniref:Uncharacterized protein n=1 Tax=Myoviridae sp. ctkfK18 TaxID=2825165 RepID=A0A8S5VHA4_9CAUD|nr:MAG TPA: hypothetical protein [Myoviridae sp. ctkfK18]